MVVLAFPINAVLVELIHHVVLVVGGDSYASQTHEHVLRPVLDHSPSIIVVVIAIIIVAIIINNRINIVLIVIAIIVVVEGLGNKIGEGTQCKENELGGKTKLVNRHFFHEKLGSEQSGRFYFYLRVH
jgi:hypothetical protein|tara:strand:- start:99 stop:482 length:384 start_codon:yes stop_codon:yes gene_type:complete